MQRLNLAGWVRRRGWRSRIGRRIALMFLLAAAVPLLLGGVGGAVALFSWWEQQTQTALHRSTREVGQGLLARLQEADDLLSDWPSADGEGASPVGLPGRGRVFRSALWLAADGGTRLHLGAPPPGEPSSWQAELGAAAVRRGVALRGATSAEPRHRATLVLFPSSGTVQVWMARASAGGWWLTQLEPDHLWEPLRETGAGRLWRVFDARQRPLAEVQDGGAQEAQTRRAAWNLFLGGEFGADDWVVEQHAPPARMELGGVPLLRWSLQFGTVVLLIVAWLSLTQIRRILGPLDALIEGTRRLARREPAARVPVLGRDEFGELARSFNEMSGRIDAQIRSLEALGLIDRAIVDGQPLPAVLDQLLAQVLVRTGGRVAAAVCLADAAEGQMSSRRPSTEQPVRVQWRRRPEGGQASADRLGGSLPGLLGSADQAVWQQWELAGPWPPAESQAMDWTNRLPLPEGGVWWGWPVRWADEGRAVLLVGFAGEPDEARRHAAADLRDRMAVALAAHQRERMLQWRASHDDLTGLANRSGLNDVLHRWLSAVQPPLPLSIMFVDLDRFKEVNDSQGHEMGDRLLQQAAERLTAVVPPLGLVARNGGDEFVVAVPHLDEDGAVEVARRICERLAVPFSCGGHEHRLGASVGVAVAPHHGRDRATLLRHADMAMYAAKEAGRGRYSVFAESLDQVSGERSRLLADLRRAVASDDELVLHYQPRVGTSDGRIRSVEALVRWQHPDLGLLPPGRFIPLAEESDLIEALGHRVLRLACAQMARWQVEGVGIERVSVNVSPRQLASGRLRRQVIGALTGQGLSPHMLELEVTESLLVGDAASAMAQLQTLRDLGVLIALDDFGTGYSSLSILRQLPIDVMKVDRAFVKDLGQDEAALAVTRTILTLARSLGKHTVAEGMETAEQAQVLRELGVDEMQGYWFSRPLPPDELLQLPQWADRGGAVQERRRTVPA